MSRLVYRGAVMVLMLAAPAMTPALAAADQSTPVVDNPAERVHCKSWLETGSLVKRVKECHTKAAWEKLYRNGKEDAKSFLWNNTPGGGGANAEAERSAPG